MSQFTLSIQQPFKQESISVKWVSITSPSGSFVVGPGHRPLVSAVEPESTVVYDSGSGEKAIRVPESGGLVHVVKNTVILFLG